MPTTRGLPGPAIGLAAAGGLLIYAGVTDKSPIVALRELVKGTASGPAPWERPTVATSGTATEIGGGTEHGSRAAGIAVQQIGKPYRWGGKGPDSFDCSGLVFFAYRQAGASEYRYLTTAGIMASPRFVKIDRASVGAGDLLWRPGHVAIAISNTELVEAPRTGIPVRRRAIDNSFRLYLRYAPARRPGTGRAI